ncbi:DUF6524 family protein [Pseudomonadota bacterium]|jgi:hypothetical protein
MSEKVGIDGFLARWVFALVLVLGTYNPSGYSYITWVLDGDTSFGPVVVIIGLLLLIGWIFCVKTTFDAIGWLGVTLGAALFAAIIWLLVDVGWLSLESTGIMTWLALVVISLILAVGMAWSHVKRRITGQLNVDDVDD